MKHDGPFAEDDYQELWLPTTRFLPPSRIIMYKHSSLSVTSVVSFLYFRSDHRIFK